MVAKYVTEFTVQSTKASNGVVAVTPPVTGLGTPPKTVEVWTELLPVR